MTTIAQTSANRRNASCSTGPRSAQGKANSRLNATKHGLRAEQVVLPTEDPDEYREHSADWHDDWKPATATRRHLVERLAVVSWRMRRCVRVESARLTERINQSLETSRRREAQALDLLCSKLDSDPSTAVANLETTRGGVDLLMAAWSGLEEAATTHLGWKDYDDHFMFIYIHGMMPGDDEAVSLKGLSWRLVVYNNPEDAEDSDGQLLTTAEAVASASEIRWIASRKLQALRELWRTLPDSTAERERQAELAAFIPRPEDESLRRYECQFEREVSRGIAQLIKLAASDADLAREMEPEAPNEPIAEPARTEQVAESAVAEVVSEPLVIAPATHPEAVGYKNGRSEPVLNLAEPVNGRLIAPSDQ